jgi:hypothetical protein
MVCAFFTDKEVLAMADYIYFTTLPLSQCINMLLDTDNNNHPGNYYSYRYTSTLLSDHRLYLIFYGMRRFGKAKRTEFILDLFPESQGCRIELQFHRELLGLPAMTSPMELDDFFHCKLHAQRHTT